MKTYRFLKFTSLLLLAGLLAVASGCAKRGYQTSEKTAAHLQSAATRLEAAGRQMDIAITELDGLVNNPQADLRPQFDRYSAAVKQISPLSTNIAKANLELQNRTKLHMESWDKEISTINNESIRASAQARKQEVVNHFAGVSNACVAAQTALAPVQAELLDVQRYLNSDLTMGGLAAIKDTATRAGKNAAPARESIAKLVSELRTLGTALAPQNAAAAPAAPAAAPDASSPTK